MNLALHHFRTEQRLYWRSRELAFFTFLLPIVFFVLLGSVYGNDEIDGVDGPPTCSPGSSATASSPPRSPGSRSSR